MEKINLQATETFARLLDKLDKKTHVQLEALGSLPLAIEKLEEDIHTDHGVGTQYSLVHFFTVGGDYMADPEMCFIVIDSRAEKDDFPNLKIYPHFYKSDVAAGGRDQESIQWKGNLAIDVNLNLQADQTHYANTWLRNIEQKGFLK